MYIHKIHIYIYTYTYIYIIYIYVYSALFHPVFWGQSGDVPMSHKKSSPLKPHPNEIPTYIHTIW